jgi:hypothetical protein
MSGGSRAERRGAEPDDPQPNLYRNNRIFFAGLMD